MANLFKRAKEAVMNFFGMNNQKAASGIKTGNSMQKKEVKPNMGSIRGSKWAGWNGYTPFQKYEMARNRWKTGGTTSCFRNLRVA